jgi:hypothetical protein
VSRARKFRHSSVRKNVNAQQSCAKQKVRRRRRRRRRNWTVRRAGRDTEGQRGYARQVCRQSGTLLFFPLSRISIKSLSRARAHVVCVCRDTGGHGVCRDTGGHDVCRDGGGASKVRVVARIAERTGGTEAKVKKSICRIVTSDNQTVSAAAAAVS